MQPAATLTATASMEKQQSPSGTTANCQAFAEVLVTVLWVILQQHKKW